MRELGDLGDAAGDGDARHGMGAQIFQRAADEIAHVEQRRLRQIVERLHRRLRGAARGAGNMGEPGGARHVDAVMDRGDPRRAGIGDHHAGGAEDRQPADDAEPRVQRLRRHLLAMRNGNLDLDIAAAPERARHLGDCRLHHLARHRIDRRLSRRHRQPRQSDGADARPSLELHAAPRRALPHRSEHQRSVRHVGIVAGILDHAGGCRSVVLAVDGKREGDGLTAGKRYLDGIRKLAGQQRGEGGLGRGRGAGAGGPAAAERASLVEFVHAQRNRALPLACHRGGCPA